MALDKTTMEVPFIKGMNQKPSQEVTDMDVPFLLRNVEMRKGTGLVKRPGREEMSTTVLGPGASLPTFETVARVATREDELVAICGSHGAWGSQGGAGAAGDTVFSYSELEDSWKAFGKIGRPTSDVIYSAPPTDTSLSEVDSAAINGRLMTVTNRDTGTHVTIIDLETQTRIINNEHLVTPITQIVCFAYDDKFFIFGADSSDNLVGYVYDTDFHFSGILGPTTIAATALGAGSEGVDVTTDGTYMFLSYDFVAGGTHEVRLVRLAPNLGIATPAVTVAVLSAGGGGHNAVHYGAGTVNVAYVKYNGAQEDVALRRVTNGTTLALSTETTVASDVFSLASGVRVITQSLTESVVFWDTIYDTGSEVGGLDGSGDPPKVWWRPVLGTVSAPEAAANPHAGVNLKLWAEPFILSTRVYLPVLGTRFVQPGSGAGSPGYYNGAFLCEVNTAATTSPYITLMPVGANFIDVMAFRYGRKTSVVDNKAYITASYRQHNPNDPDGQHHYVEYPIVSTVVYDFADFYRWQPANHKHDVLFSGALPYMFDGANTYECGFVWRPEIMGSQLAAGGNLSSGQVYSYRVTMEFRDHRGNRFNSAPSYAVEALELAPSGGNLSVKLAVNTCPLSMKGDASAYFPGKSYFVFWRGNAGQVAAGEYVRVGEARFHPYDQTNYVFTDTKSDDDVDAAERLYIVGGELENYTPPPCRVLFQHRDRLIAYNTESKTVWYTKPMAPERSIEWSLSQQIPVPEDVMAGASLENSAILFTRTKCYALEGAGPGSNGLPPDGFSRLTLINADIGCSEICGAWRTPAGVIFKSDDGFWLVTRGYEFQYIGAVIEDEAEHVERVAAGIVDTSKGCFRLFYQRDESVEVDASAYSLNYWYDTGRWSRDDFASLGDESGQALVGATMWKGEPVFADSERIWRFGDSFIDGADGFYPMGVTMGWARFGDLGSFKRVWRTVLTAKAVGTSNVRLVFYKNYLASPFQTVEFDPANVGVNAQVRVHMSHQKLSALRFELTEVEGDDAESEGWQLFGVTFELGIKKGAVKLAAARST